MEGTPITDQTKQISRRSRLVEIDNQSNRDLSSKCNLNLVQSRRDLRLYRNRTRISHPNNSAATFWEPNLKHHEHGPPMPNSGRGNPLSHAVWNITLGNCENFDAPNFVIGQRLDGRIPPRFALCSIREASGNESQDTVRIGGRWWPSCVQSDKFAAD